MNDIAQKALALINEILKERRIGGDCDTIYRATDATDEALCRAIEQHEAFRQEVSDALHVWYDGTYPPVLDRFILSTPKPDPLVEAWKKQYPDDPLPEASCNILRAALDARGLEIREKGQ